MAVLAAAIVCPIADALAQDSETAGSEQERRQLLGDWGGARSTLADHGIIVNVQATQFYQGVASGGAEQRFRYGAKFDLFAELNTEKMGLWKGGSMMIHAANWNFGQNSVTDATFLAPVNANLL